MTRRLISSGSSFEREIGYSRAVVAGEWCFVSGTTGYDYASMAMPDDPASQARNALLTIRRSLEEAGFSLNDVVRLRYILTDRSFAPAIIPVLGETFGEIRPAATMIVAGLLDPAMKVEIDATAYRPR